MTKLHTNAELLDALTEASKKPVTADEIRRQRVSFIMGSLSDDSTVTRAKVTKILAAHEQGHHAH